jgi:hypothetical protein
MRNPAWRFHGAELEPLAEPDRPSRRMTDERTSKSLLFLGLRRVLACRPACTTGLAACLACHDDDIIGQQRLGRAEWDREIQKMVNWGARVTDDERARFLEYLTNRYNARLR